ncbi:MAG TPA: TolC family protein [Solimonas sp.]|nr:TolC family protein [Solimonas sp.]
MYFPVAWRSAVALMALLASPLWASEPLTLREALRRAEAAHPDLQGFGPERAGADAGRSLAGRVPMPELSLLLEDALGSGSRSSLDSAQWTLGFSQALELGGQRSGRLDLADVRSAALSASQEQRRRDALAEVAQRFYEAAADRERLRLAEEQVELARKTLAAADERVRSARAPVAERARAQAAMAQAVLEREHAEHEELSARVSLAVAMGTPEPDFGELQALLFELPPLRSLPELRQRLQQSPAARARLAEAAVLDAERRAALAAGGLRPTLTAGARRYEDADDVAAVLGLSLPLFAGRRAGDEAAIVAARQGQGEAESRAALLRAEEALFERYQELGHAREALRLLDTEVLPARREALKQTQYAYDRGRYGYLELSQVLQELVGARRERLDTAVRYHSLLAELERITGENLIEGNIR